jgi:hypothetical protein
MKRTLYLIALLGVALSTMSCSSCSQEKTTSPPPIKLPVTEGAILINHTTRNIDAIPQEAIEQAKSTLHIAYGHTSHGSQLVDGMTGLIDFKGELYRFNNGGSGGALDLRDKPSPMEGDLGSNSNWDEDTRDYLDDHPEINVVIWSWCGQVSSASESDIYVYLARMSNLETDYAERGVKFVYMTGHLDGYGLTGNLHIRNEQIRAYCAANKKILYDFADIESYNPDGVYFLDKDANDNCDYDGDGDGHFDGNWAIEWQNAHPGEWYNCTAAHTQPLNGNLKAYAAWWLWARLAGWQGPD